MERIALPPLCRALVLAYQLPAGLTAGSVCSCRTAEPGVVGVGVAGGGADGVAVGVGVGEGEPIGVGVAVAEGGAVGVGVAVVAPVTSKASIQTHAPPEAGLRSPRTTMRSVWAPAERPERVKSRSWYFAAAE